MAADAEHGFILGGHATSAHRSDTRELMEVVAKAEAVEGSMVFADKGYSSVDNC